MKILLCGYPSKFSKLRRALLLNDFEITYCMDSERVSEKLGPFGGDFDWVIRDGSEIVGRQMALTNTLCTLGSCPKLDHLNTANGIPENNEPLTVCGIHQTQEGILKLRCGLHKMMTTPKSLGTHHSMDGEGSFVLEYHAPGFRKGN